MKAKTLLATLLALAMVFTLAMPVLAAPPFGMTNQGFETGDFTGWTVNTGAAGDASVVTFFDQMVNKDSDGNWDDYVSYSPVYGTYFAVLTNGAEDEYTTMRQDLTMEAGDTVEVSFFFVCREIPNEPTFYDHGSISIYQGATWLGYLCFNDTANTATPWTAVDWTAPSAGTYTLVVDVVNVGDDDPTYLSFIGVDIDYYPDVEEVDIDIKPCSDPNSVNLKSKGVLPVAIISTEVFDATTVDWESVTLDAVPAIKAEEVDVNDTQVCDGGECWCTGADGLIDLVVYFNTSDFVDWDEDTIEAMLEGETYGGTSIQGIDAVRIVTQGPKNP